MKAHVSLRMKGRDPRCNRLALVPESAQRSFDAIRSP
jgi:hypothetical protein